MKQEYKSANTSVNTTKLPAIYSKIDWLTLRAYLFSHHMIDEGQMPLVLDYGCGKKTDHIARFLHYYNFNFLGYDPYWFDKGTNTIAVRSNPDICICSNVLNVIKEKDIVDRVHCEVIRQSKSGQLYFISVYEGDKSYAGRQTKPNCWQRNETTDMYLFNKEALKRKVITSQLGSCFVF